jgi:hypothetical protein
MDKKYIILLVFLVASCASVYNRNSVSKGEISFSKGKKGGVSWDTKLVFSRYSMYSDLNLNYDILVTTIDSKSDFYRWFSVDEKNELAKCERIYLFFNYQGRPRGFKHSEFEKQLDTHAFKKILVEGFYKNLKNHPSFVDNMLMRYQLVAACGTEKLKIEAPGFDLIHIN